MAYINDSYLTQKDAELCFRPTTLWSIQFPNGGPTIWFSDAYDGNPGPGVNQGITYNGDPYVAAVVNQRFGAMQSTGMGIDSYATASIDLADATGNWLNYEAVYGYGGATITATFVFYDPNTNRFSPDSKVVFFGMCDPAVPSQNLLTINAVSSYALNKQLVPYMPIQRTCPKFFPENTQQQSEGLTNPLSIYADCGYSPDVGGVGNSGFTTCSKTKTDCVARGMFSYDSRGNATARFGGCQWEPPATWRGRSYVAGRTLQGVNCENLPKYSQFVPLTYGNTWVNGICDNVVGDPNSTRGEVILGYGDYQIGGNWTDKIQAVVVNGGLIPYATQTSDLLLRWYGLSEGGNGYINPTAIYNGQGDPHGSMLTIMPIVYAAMASSNTPFSVRALVGMRPIPNYLSPTNYVISVRDEVSWVVLDLLRLFCPDLFAKVDIQSVMDCAGIDDGLVPIRLTDGSIQYNRRYHVCLSIEKPGTLLQVIEGLKIAGNLMMSTDATGNTIRFRHKLPLGDQHPSPVPGSNYTGGALTCYHITDTWGSPTADGFPAYVFDESTIIPGTMKFVPQSIENLPNIIQASLQDEYNTYTPDQISVALPGAYQRVGKKNQNTLAVMGFPNYSAALRSINTKFAELWNGNPSGDYRGSWVVQFQTSFRAIHLTTGDIVQLTWSKWPIHQQLFRIESISAVKGCERLTITARWHSDQWVLDGFGFQ